MECPEKSNVFPEHLMPISTQEALEEVEERIGADPSFKRSVIRKLGSFCGMNANKTIRTIAKLLLDDKLLSEYSWLGTSNKKNFLSTKIYLELLLRQLGTGSPASRTSMPQNFLKRTSSKSTSFSLETFG